MTKLHVYSDGTNVILDLDDGKDPDLVWCLPLSSAEAEEIANHLMISAILVRTGLSTEQFFKIKLMGATGGTA